MVKNKIAPPFRVVEFDIMFNEGISYVGDLVDLAVEHKFADKTGSWYCMGETRLGQGRERAKQFLRDNPDIANDLKEKILDKLDPRRQPADEAGEKTPEGTDALPLKAAGA